jgi:hypothetical protein
MLFDQVGNQALEEPIRGIRLTRQRVAVEVTFLAHFLLALAEADARSTAVLVDELDAGGF